MTEPFKSSAFWSARLKEALLRDHERAQKGEIAWSVVYRAAEMLQAVETMDDEILREAIASNSFSREDYDGDSARGNQQNPA